MQKRLFTVNVNHEYFLFMCKMERSHDETSLDEDNIGLLDGCVLLTEDQLDSMMIQLNNETNESDVHSRQKRSMTDFTWLTHLKWPMPITYKFDGSHCE